jgi:hypothetical protein
VFARWTELFKSLFLGKFFEENVLSFFNGPELPIFPSAAPSGQPCFATPNF